MNPIVRRVNWLATVYTVGALCAVLCMRKQGLTAVMLALCVWLLATAWVKVRKEL